MKRIMYVGGGWGNSIDFWPEHEPNPTKIVGFKPWDQRFSEGSVLFDLAHNLHEDTIPLYYVHDIEWQRDPSDMFFAKVSLIGRVENRYKYSRDNLWFVRPCCQLLKKLEHKRRMTSCFKIRERKKLKKYIEALQEMIRDD